MDKYPIRPPPIRGLEAAAAVEGDVVVLLDAVAADPEAADQLPAAVERQAAGEEHDAVLVRRRRLAALRAWIAAVEFVEAEERSRTAAVDAGAGSAGDLRFRDAYEEIFQRSLVGGTASLGYDAALVLLEALRPGRVAPDEVTRSMARLSGVEGATGVFSVVDGRVVRTTSVVRIQNRRLVPESAGWPASPDAIPDSILQGGVSRPSDVAQPVDTGVVVDTMAIPALLVPSSNY